VSFLLVIFLLALGAAFSKAEAQSPSNVMPEGLFGTHKNVPLICAENAEDMYNALRDTHNERPYVMAFLGNMNSVVWFTDPEHTTVSIVVDTPAGSCMVFSGNCLPGDCFIQGANIVEDEEEELEALRNLSGTEL